MSFVFSTLLSGYIPHLMAVCLVGVVCGFASSTPPGVINLWISNAVLTKREKHLAAFVGGVVAADALFAALATWGHGLVTDRLGLQLWIEVAGGLLIICMGLLGWQLMIKSQKPPAAQGVGLPRRPRSAVQAKVASLFGQCSEGDASPFANFALGILLCGFNPGFLMFWIFVASTIEVQMHFKLTATLVPALIFGLVIGDLLWFQLLMMVVRKSRESLETSTLQRIRKGVASSFILLGAYTMLHAIVGLTN